jgi:hypothetical protein
MARLRTPAPVRAGTVPEALTDLHHPTWTNLDAYNQLCADTGIDPRTPGNSKPKRAPWWARFTAYRRAWCLANGYGHPVYLGTIDYPRATAAGIDTSSTSRYRLRVLT